jgi:hypothetical protein
VIGIGFRRFLAELVEGLKSLQVVYIDFFGGIAEQGKSRGADFENATFDLTSKPARSR